MRIRVTTQVDLFEKRKQEHIDCGYRIEEERPMPVNGLCSFIAVTEQHSSDDFAQLINAARRGRSGLLHHIRHK